MSSQPDVRRLLLSEPRLRPYLNDAGQDLERAWSTYLWANELSGALHAQISLVEVAIRNALDRAVSAWNVANGGSAEWTLPGNAQEPLYALLKDDLNKARRAAAREAVLRTTGHPRQGVTAGHDDIVAQLMFGTWVKLLRPMSKVESPHRQVALWSAGLNTAFPGADQSDAGRAKIGKQLDSIRRLRNRVAHHDNLLGVKTSSRLNQMLSLVHKANAAYPRLVMANSSVRRIARDDPRRVK